MLMLHNADVHVHNAMGVRISIKQKLYIYTYISFV